MKKIILGLMMLSTVAFSSGIVEVISNKSGEDNVKLSYWEKTTKNNRDKYEHVEEFTNNDFKEHGRIIYDIDYEREIISISLLAYKSMHLLEKGVNNGKIDVLIRDIGYGQFIKADVIDKGPFYVISFSFNAKDKGCNEMMEILSSSIINVEGKDKYGRFSQLTYILENPITEYALDNK